MLYKHWVHKKPKARIQNVTFHSGFSPKISKRHSRSENLASVAAMSFEAVTLFLATILKKGRGLLATLFEISMEHVQGLPFLMNSGWNCRASSSRKVSRLGNQHIYIYIYKYIYIINNICRWLFVAFSYPTSIGMCPNLAPLNNPKTPKNPAATVWTAHARPERTHTHAHTHTYSVLDRFIWGPIRGKVTSSAITVKTNTCIPVPETIRIDWAKILIGINLWSIHMILMG